MNLNGADQPSIQPETPPVEPVSSGKVSPLIQAFDDVFNNLLSLTFEIAQIRTVILVTIMAFTWIALAFLLHPWFEWKLVISWMLGLIPPPADINPYSRFVMDLASRFFAMDVIMKWIILITPFMIALQAATLYLSDIFELSDQTIAQNYITQAAFAYPQNYHIIHIRNGQVAPEDQNSPLLHIGGPGVVEVGLENVAVFERFHHPWEIIGPENNYKRLDGFERLRDVVDLREHHQEIEVDGRTRDGIRLSIRNMRILFHVLRDEKQTSDESTGYTYHPDSIKKLVFDEPLPEGRGVPWFNAITTLLRDELERFIGEHNLSEILASAVEPGQNITPGGMLAFIPRMELSNSLFDLRGGFVNRAKNHGLWLEWVDVGTWQVQGDALTQQHIDAWKLTRENQFKSSNWNLGKLKEQTRLKELHQKTVEIPILSFAQLIQQNRPRNEVVQSLLQELSGILNSAMVELDKLDPAIKLTSKPGLKKQIQKTLVWIRKYMKPVSPPVGNGINSRPPQSVPVSQTSGSSATNTAGSVPPAGNPPTRPPQNLAYGNVKPPTTVKPPVTGQGATPASANPPAIASRPQREEVKPPMFSPAQEPDNVPPQVSNKPDHPAASNPTPEPEKPSSVESTDPSSPETPASTLPQSANNSGRPEQTPILQAGRRPAPIPPGSTYSPKEPGENMSKDPGRTEPDQPQKPPVSTEPEYIPLDDINPQEPE